MNYEQLLGIFLHLKCHPEDVVLVSENEIQYVMGEYFVNISISCSGNCVMVTLPNLSIIDIDTTPEELAEVKYYIERITEISNEYWINRMLCTVSL